MDALLQESLPSAVDSQWSFLLNQLILTYLSGYYSICVIKPQTEFIRIDVEIPTVVVTVDDNFRQNFQNGVDSGCQAFVVQQNALWSFLDTFMDAHDYADQRSADKKLIVLLESVDDDTFERICDHPAMRDLPNNLMVVSSQGNDSIEFYTTEIFGSDTVTVQIRPVLPSDLFPAKNRNLNGIPIRFQSVEYLPFAYMVDTTPEKSNAKKDPRYYADDSPISIDGTESRLLVEFCHCYNCTIEAYIDDVNFWGTVEENRTATGILGAVATRKADFAVSAIYYWLGPYRFATYTNPISRSGLTVLLPKPQTLAPWRTPFLSFSKDLWIAVGVAFGVGVLAVWLVEKGRVGIRGAAPGQGQPKNLGDSVLAMIGFYMEQNAFLRNDLVSCVFLFTALLFAGFMVGNLYGAGLAGIMTIPQYEHPIETRLDLAASNLPFVGNDIAWMYALMASQQAYMQKIVHQYKVVDDKYMTKHRNTRDVGFIGERSQFGHFGPVDYLDVESSNVLQLLKEDLAYQHCTVLVSKTCPFKQSFNDLFGIIQQSGIQYYWETVIVNSYMSLAIQQNIMNSKVSSGDGDAVVLTVLHFMGAFLILGLGCLLATVMFCLEHLYFYLLKNKTMIQKRYKI